MEAIKLFYFSGVAGRDIDRAQAVNEADANERLNEYALFLARRLQARQSGRTSTS